jgi:pimeloyl-ACP methyl ester carboxylesterase
MPYASTNDGVKIYFEEAGSGTAVIFVHEYPADYRTWEPQMRALSRQHRCVTFSARGYPRSDMPMEPEAYSQKIACDDVIALMDHLSIERAHVVGHSMGAYTALNLGLDHPDRCRSLAVAGCGWGSTPGAREEAARSGREIADLFLGNSMDVAADKYANYPVRLQYKSKDPRGWREFRQ